MARLEGGSFWGGDRVQRLHPRLVAELLLDSLEFHEEPRVLMDYLRREGFYPDFVRSKGYVGLTATEAVAILPMLSFDLSRVAGIGIRRSLDEPDDEEVGASATIVRLAHGVEPLDFTVVAVERGKVRALRPMSFDRLREGDPREAARELASAAERRKLDGIRLTRVTRGRAIAAAVIEDLAREEADIGFISESEYNHLSKDAELYADVARLHSYLSAVSTGRAKGDGCRYCTSTSSYVCTSTSCNITIGGRKVAAASREAP
jgi:hypothetical protein